MVKPRYSIIIPVKNEAQSLPQLFDELAKVLPKQSEIIVVDDASIDTSAAVIRNISRITPITLISLPTHQGKWSALRAGFAKAQGQTIITLDADLQDNPKELPKLLAEYHKGYAIVSGWRHHRKDPVYKTVISDIGNAFITLITHQAFHDLNAPFKIYHRTVLDQIPTEGTLLRFSLLLAFKTGYSVKEVAINHRPRKFGESKFGPKKYFRILYDLILIQLLFSGSGTLRDKTEATIDDRG